MDQLTIIYGAGNAQLPATEDDYGGVVVEMKEHMDSDVFHALLKTSMLQWKLQGKKGVWIKLPIDLVNLVETAVKEGFSYHHAEPKYLMLAHWLAETTNTLPVNASHIARVGAIVLNDKQEILVVQEKIGILQGVWKISTGILEQGEDIHVGVVREVKEETGIVTEFVEVLAFSQKHDVFFGKSEVLFLCMMRPLSFDIQIQDSEIEAAKWMPLEEYAAQTCAQEQSLREQITKLCRTKLGRGCTGFTPTDVYWRRSFLSWKTPYLQHFQVPLGIEEKSDIRSTTPLPG
ncbi:hypothetical protein L6452_40009 [Arctium lappa]|uniref:Uncharacterized protein n=1 Tax=Arctium lappa TaxID=4217 RepID=A0ACB8XV02_ARCLA|nr:hypothetical protein L6452_40009 [Arctium lappa]